jgi:hypothetical protein
MSRFSSTSFVALVCFIFVILGCFMADSKLDPTRIHLVDVIKLPNGGENYIFRSSAPVSDKRMVWTEWMTYIQERAEKTLGHTIKNPYVVDITLMNPLDQPQAENDFWADPNNADKGRYVVWPMGLSGLYDPRIYDVQTQNIMSNSTVWEYDLIPTRLQEFFNMINQPGPIDKTTGKPRPQIFIPHCAAGCDRTGQFIIAYRLATTKHWSSNTLQELFKRNIDECGRIPNDWSVVGTSWFCIYMRYNFGIKMGDCLNIADCKRFGDCTWPPASLSFEDEEY